MPAIARPTISMYDESAAPQIADPSSKIVKKERNVHCMVSYMLGRRSMNRPCC